MDSKMDIMQDVITLILLLLPSRHARQMHSKSTDFGKPHDKCHSVTQILDLTLPIISDMYDPTKSNILSGGQFSYVIVLPICSANLGRLLRISNEAAMKTLK